MADHKIQLETENPLAHVPLLEPNPKPTKKEDDEETHLEKTFQQLDMFLAFLGFHQSSVINCVLSWFVFLVVGIVLPIVGLELTDCDAFKKYRIKDFEFVILASRACLAAVSLLCISYNLRKYGIRKFLSVDRQKSSLSQLHKDYVKKIWGSVRMLLFWVLPCFVLKIAHEVIRMLYGEHESWWLSVAVLLAMIISWTYLSLIYLSATVLFHLVCSLQVIHFDDYVKLLQTETDILLLIEEHNFLSYYLSKISHRFRIFLLLELLLVTASQLVALFLTTGYRDMITLINGGDFAIAAILQLVGIILCLHGAIKISYRAQGIASVASRWHALVSCGPDDASQPQVQNSNENSETSSRLKSITTNYSESDLDSLDIITMPTTSQLDSYKSSYHKRQAFVMYLQSNTGGITIFGWKVDRALMNTIFFVELGLVTFVLGKTLVFS